ncbi:hypothetical protein BGW36DRAFT_423588 [Talaromyces proteolyticus]|uniref:Paraoxonase n=1 Tax=Talaromyces proteolyticus TaxID=1131652 RepID=A0AAD4KZT2_9EURO|nr:uncharacterized protein BGW36DRAFT_423588 [Talaromyces proteolyticus]KAH8704062.1 hypothetical protein BGW36DRAFT_423588 [Talaromyces proteolyticus]
MARLPQKALTLTIWAAILAYISPYLLNRYQALSILFNNRPDKLLEVNVLPKYSVKFADRLRNCEDALIDDENAVAILSCDTGRDLWNTVMGTYHEKRDEISNGELLIYRYDLPENSEKSLAPIKIVDYPGVFSLHPLGVEYHHQSSTLFVVNHHLDGSRVDVFSLDLASHPPVARHKQSITSPLINAPNAIAALNDHEFYVTNDHYSSRREHPWFWQVETYLAFPGGTLTYVSLASETPQIQNVAHIPFANGVTLMNESILAVSSTSTAQVRLYNILSDRSVKLNSSIEVPFMPDNLSADKDGVLLIAGHPHPPSLEEVVKHRLSCTQDSEADNAACWKANVPSWVSQWSSSRGLEHLFVSKQEFGTSATAARDSSRKVGLISGLYENGILVWRG